MTMSSKRYQLPRKAQLQDGNVFSDKKTGRKKADKYTGQVFKAPGEAREFMKEMQSYQKKI